MHSQLSARVLLFLIIALYGVGWFSELGIFEAMGAALLLAALLQATRQKKECGASEVAKFWTRQQTGLVFLLFVVIFVKALRAAEEFIF